MNPFVSRRLGRRTWLRASAAGLFGLSIAGGLRMSAAAPAAKSPKRCVVLWMDGGPSHIDTFDPKPEAGSNVRGVLDAIDTKIAGVQFSERFAELSRRADRLAVVRGMSTDEADHGRARIYMRTGYKPGQGGLAYPVLGSIVSGELGRPATALPNFIVTGTPLGKYDFVTDPGFRGPQFGALVHDDCERPLENLEAATAVDEFARRTRTLAEVNAAFAGRYSATPIAAQRAVFDQTVRLMEAGAARAFDLQQEPARGAERYGRHPFGRGCLLARRLVEAEVSFVEVHLSNWDTHEKNVAEAAPGLMSAVDQGMSALLDDLGDRGLLDDTLVVWMGEFGRTPTLNRNGGRDHYAKAWSTVLAGAGIRGGTIVGRTDENGSEVRDRAVNVRDFMATLCRALDIDPAKKIDTPIGREVPIVDAGGEPIAELFG
jgi:hypothetical protein